MPADICDDPVAEDTSTTASAEGASGARDFDAAHWAPDEQEYGILNCLMCRAAMDEILAKPSAVEHLKTVDSNVVSLPAPLAAHGRGGRKKGGGGEAGAGGSSEDDDSEISEGEPYEATEPVAWPGKANSWWRVNSSLGEDVIVREGVSVASPELRRFSPGELLQQAGLPRALAQGRARGCVRLPVRPVGWVTADATKAGGPKYLIRASVPRWRVVHQPTNPHENGNVIVRDEPALQSDEVAVLHFGDIVEQAGPSLTRPDGIVRMPVTTQVTRRNEANDDEHADTNHNQNRNNSKQRVLGWVTLDASEAGGPVFFKPAAEADNKRRRRPKVS